MVDDDTPSGLHHHLAENREALLRFLTARTGSPADADDILQDLWIKLNAGIQIGPIGQPRAYLFAMANNLVLDRVRAAARRQTREHDWFNVALDQRAHAGEPAVGNTAEHIAIARDEAARLAAAIAALPPGAARAFRLHKIDGLSHAETASRLGISRKGVEKHMATAFAHLRRLLSDEDR